MHRTDYLRALSSAPLALMPEVLAELVAASDLVVADRMRRAAAVAAAPRGSVAVVPVHGLITQRGDSLLSALFGGTSAAALAETMRTLTADPSISAIVLDVDSPGGSVYGVEEAAHSVADAAAIKPVYAVANSLAASAAYWIASQATRLYVTPGGDVGSIGVYTLHLDFSQALAVDGIKPTFVFAGEHKVEGNFYEPLSDGARSYLQDQVDETYATFLAAVAAGRKTTPDAVRSGMGKGRVVGASRAKTAGMVDDVATLQEVITQLIEAPTPGRRAAVNARLGSATLRQLGAASAVPEV